MTKKPYLGPERRSTPRYSLVVIAAAVPVDKQARPTGEPILVMTRDISMHGLAWICNEPIEAEFLGLQMPAGGTDALEAVVQIVRHRICGRFHEYGGKFLGRMAT